MVKYHLKDVETMETLRLDELAARQFGTDVATAAALIMEGRVYIGHVPADKPGTAVPMDTPLILREKAKKYASRSGYKLEKALAHFGIDPTGLTVCDIGASNGGFTDCLLQSGAAHVFAVDVAYGILAWELRQDERVTVLERTNARHLTPEHLQNTVCDMVTVDVSFISLKKIFPAIRRIVKDDRPVVTLIKPQFEARPNQLGKNGILRDPEGTLPPLLADIFASAAENGLFLQGLTVSPIHGTNGNVEYLAYYRTEPAASADAERLIHEVLSQQPDV
ncbi:MAG: TlyA family RNA methyltransferase [Ruminococcaceae bacterium]|nr:TlyA family RNA methyltransferase [Oscillospiraceae bacterium]